MRTLSNKEVAELIFWKKTTGSSNWGGWSNYPLSGCTFTSIEDCHIFVKFNNPVKYADETFTHVVSSRSYCKENRISFSLLESHYNESGDTLLNDLIKEQKLKEVEAAKIDIARVNNIKKEAATLEYRKKCEETVINDLQYAMDTYCINRSFHKTDFKSSVGCEIKEYGSIYLGSGATAVHSSSVRVHLEEFEEMIKSTMFTYLIYRKSKKGNTKYAKMIDTDIEILKDVVMNDKLITMLVDEKIEKALNTKSIYE